MLSVSPQIAGVLHDTYRRMLGTPPDDHFQLYDYVSTTMAGIASVDAFYVGLFDGATKLRIPYCFDGQKYVMPGTHTFAPNGPTAWVFRERRTYRWRQDDGRVVHAGMSFGDIRRISADAVTVPLFRNATDQRDLFGLVSIHSYSPGVYDEAAVSAFEWLADVLARILTREQEELHAIARLPGSVPALRHPLAIEEIVELVVEEVDKMRDAIDRIRSRTDLPSAAVTELRTVTDAGRRLQGELTEMLLRTDDGPTRRFRRLTDREQAVAMLLADQLTNPDIATRLNVSVATVKTHVANIRAKYEMNRREDVAKDVRLHLGRAG